MESFVLVKRAFCTFSCPAVARPNRQTGLAFDTLQQTPNAQICLRVSGGISRPGAWVSFAEAKAVGRGLVGTAALAWVLLDPGQALGPSAAPTAGEEEFANHLASALLALGPQGHFFVGWFFREKKKHQKKIAVT